MFWQVLRMESDKIFKRKIFWIELALLALVFILIYVIAYLLISPQSPQIDVFTWPRSLGISLSISNTTLMGGMLMIVLVGLVTAQEYAWRTMQLWLSQGISRWLLIGVKALVLLIPLICTILASVVISGCLSAILSLIVQGTVHVEQVNFAQLLLACLVEAYAMLPYLALTFMIAIVGRSALLGVSLGLIYTFIVERVLLSLGGLLRGIFASIALYLPANLESDVFTPVLSRVSTSVDHVVSTPAAAAPSVSPILAVVCIGLYTLVLCGIAFWAFSRQNMSN